MSRQPELRAPRWTYLDRTAAPIVGIGVAVLQVRGHDAVQRSGERWLRVRTATVASAWNMTLFAGLRLAQGIADRKSTMQMLTNVLLRTQGKDQLLVAARPAADVVTATPR